MSDKITLIDSDSGKIFEEAKEIYKEVTGEELILTSEDSYILSTVSALLGNIKAEMNEVALQNYLPFATGKRLDLKGVLFGDKGKRLGENQARTTIRCHLSTKVERDVLIAKGTRFIYKTLVFISEEIGIVKKGSIFVDVPVVCETSGDVGEILVGEIKEIVDRYDYFGSCENITAVTGGADIESDENFRKRLSEIPESFTSAGSEGAYKFWTKKASSLVTDVVIQTPSANILDIFVCNNQKLLSAEEKEKIKKYLMQPNLKALNDVLNIKDPKIHNYTINIGYYLYVDSVFSKEKIEEELREKLTTYTQNLRIGNSINLQDIISTCKSVNDVKKVVITQPQEFLSDEITVCSCNGIEITFLGVDEK